MIGTVKSLMATLRLAFRKPVTLQYPTEAPTLAPRFMAHPVLTWDNEVHEPYCTGCLVCARVCPTDCITVSMKDNPKFAVSESQRRKIVEDFQLNVADCIMCGLCVEYCNFDAILMSDHFDAAQDSRGKLVLSLAELLEEGKAQEAKGRWQPPTVRKAQRRTAAQGGASTAASTAAVEERTEVATGAAAAPADDRVAAARARAAAMRAQKAAERGEALAASAMAPTAKQEAPNTTPPMVPAEGPVATGEVAPIDRGGEVSSSIPEASPAPVGAIHESPPPPPATGQPSIAATDPAKPVDPRVAEARAKAAALRAQKAKERAEAEAAKNKEGGAQ